MGSFFKCSVAILILIFSFSLEAGKKRKPKGKGKPHTVLVKQKAPEVEKSENPNVVIPQAAPASSDVEEEIPQPITEEPIRRSPSPQLQEKTPQWKCAVEKLFLPKMTGPQKFIISRAAEKWTPEEIEAHADLLNANQDWLFPQDFPDGLEYIMTHFRSRITHQSLRYSSDKLAVRLSQMKERKACLFESCKSKDISSEIVISALVVDPEQVAALVPAIAQYEEAFFPKIDLGRQSNSRILDSLLKGSAEKIQALGGSGLFNYVNHNDGNRENLIKAAFKYDREGIKTRAEVIHIVIQEIIPPFGQYYGQLVTHLLGCDVAKLHALGQCKALFDKKYIEDELKALSLVQAIPNIEGALLQERANAIIAHQDILFQGVEKVYDRINIIEGALNAPAEILRDRAENLHKNVMPRFDHPGLTNGRKVFIFGQLLRYPPEKINAHLLVIQSAISAGFETPGLSNPNYADWDSHALKKKIQECFRK